LWFPFSVNISILNPMLIHRQ